MDFINEGTASVNLPSCFSGCVYNRLMRMKNNNNKNKTHTHTHTHTHSRTHARTHPRTHARTHAHTHTHTHTHTHRVTSNVPGVYSDTDSRMKMMVTKSALPRKKSMAALFRKLVRSAVIASCLCLYSGSWSSGFKYFCQQYL